MATRTTRILCLVALVALAAQAQASLKLPSQWVHGAPKEPALQVHEAAPGFWVLRQGKRTNFEAPFMYLIAGEDRALLLDTGATPEDGSELPLRTTVDRLLDTWRNRHGQNVELIVAHTHSHRDHTAGDSQFRQRPRTQVVGTAPDDVAAFFGLSNWPAGEAQLDLGNRIVVALPLPGHEPSHIALYDSTTRTLLSGDSLYPGLLTVRDLPAYRDSIAHLAEFARRHGIDQVL
jgi:glyoxylase-like metal-dependent hydrolase (beta-lactamase superfamily II)